MPDHAGPEYRGRLTLRRAETESLDAAAARASYMRLATAGAAVLVAVLAWRTSVSVWWLAAPAGVFLWLVPHHDRVIRAAAVARRAIAFYERGLARMEDRWAGTGEPGARFRDDRHPYANDLDLFGAASLFELLSTARTQDGEATLARWLLSPAGSDEIAARQAAVRDLAADLDLRERLAVAGGGPVSIDTASLITWAEDPPSPILPRLRGLTMLSAVAVAVTIGYLAVTGDLRPLVTVLILDLLFFRGLQERMERTLHVAGNKVRDLDATAEIIGHLESATVTTDRLVALQRALQKDGVHASTAIRRLHRLAEFHDWQHSMPLVPVVVFLGGYIGPAIAIGAVMLLWGPFLTVATEAWRKQHGPRVRAWVAAIAELEALASLAAFHYEHADDVFPDLVAMESGARFEGTGLGHPLLPAASMVRNDVCLGGGTALLVVSGSNMSGKSTLLRTVGINAVLACAGAPVRASSLRLSPLALGATLRIQDSLQEGRSRFYAEITRIRELADIAAGPVPLLFLLDELFHGTNSHDRLIGASGVLRSFLDRGAIGLVTTHDLALTAVADELGPRAANVHFEEWLEGGEMRFDYRMKPGPVTRSNALALMRAVGLNVDGTVSRDQRASTTRSPREQMPPPIVGRERVRLVDHHDAHASEEIRRRAEGSTGSPERGKNGRRGPRS